MSANSKTAPITDKTLNGVADSAIANNIDHAINSIMPHYNIREL